MVKQNQEQRASNSSQPTQQQGNPQDAPLCQIKWIDADGNGTSDTNKAVMMAHFHKSSRAYGGKLLRYTEYIDRSFPICAEHYSQVTPNMLYPVGGWSFYSPLFL